MSKVVVNKGNEAKRVPNKSVKKDVKIKKEPDAKCQSPTHKSDENVAIDNQLPDPPIKKMERSHSFFLTRKLSKIYDTLTGSKENLTKIPENEQEEPFFKFTRSLSLATIPLRKSYRRIVRETKLEKLHEEHPEKVDENKEECVSGAAKEQASEDDENTSPTRERSNSFLSQLKRTFSSSSEKKKPLNPKWSASLLNLQQIDVMVSYEDLSFINYDKFNTYEKNLSKPIESNYLQRASNNRMSMDERMLKKYYEKKIPPPPPLDDANVVSDPVVRRRKKNQLDRVRKSTYLDSNIDSNFDQSRNVYRNSLDETKLKFLNKVNRDSFRFSNNFERTAEDVLMLDNYLSGNDTVDSGIVNCESIGQKKAKSVDFAEDIGVINKHERPYDRHHSLYLPRNMVFLDDKDKRHHQYQHQIRTRFSVKTLNVMNS
ncbi:hypothetical protein Bhyg_02462 [Pseudolycoriella hygida]|uniref:Uncharacterized protein n=1 Tax=Pseudolycoriella hygida TaxID=35572 RepID=A0A9Q0NCP8_9DIPT|nr:hypothetical protein Bhyg_02462 [Pseudolycoriella hygida]